jgi:GT2 family glycosyltransferase
MKTKFPEVSVIIPNWNGIGLLKKCLDSLKSQSYKDFEILVIDNGSTDGSVGYIKKNYPHVNLIELKSNTGFAPAVNLGVKICTGLYTVLLNNDAAMDKDCLKFLVSEAKAKKDCGMVAAKILQMDNPRLIDSAGDYIDAVGHANNIGYGEKDGEKYEKGGYVFMVSGGGCLIKREVFESIGFFDPDYFAYMEDVDFSLRAQMAGFKAWFEPKAKIYHKHKATSSRNPGFTEYLQYRNMTMTVIKDFPKDLLLRELNWLKILLVNLNTIRYLSGEGYLIQALKAEWFVFTNIFKLLNKRKKIQSGIKVPVSYIIDNIRPKKITFFGLLGKGV